MTLKTKLPFIKNPAKRRGFLSQHLFLLFGTGIISRKRLLAAVLAVCLTGCCSPTKEAPVRLGYLQNDLHHLPAFVAVDKGLFELSGINVEVAGVFRAGPEEMSAFAAGELDIGYVGQAPATAAALNETADIRFIAQVNLEGSALVVGSGSGCKSLTCLKGKSVAIPGHATMQDFLLRRAIGQHGLTMEMLKPIVLKPPEMIQALQQQNIDAFIAWEPYPSRAVQTDRGKILLTSKDIWPEHPCCVLVASAEFCQKEPELVNRIRLVHQEACRYIKENPEQAIAVGVKYTGMDAGTVSRAIRSIKYSTDLDRAKAAEFVDFLESLRYVKTPGRTLDRALELVQPGE